MDWQQVLQVIEARLPPDDLATFRRLHKSFTGYPMNHTCAAFYDFIATRELSDLLGSFRFQRMTQIGESLSTLPLKGRHVLDVGAGGGYLAEYMRDELGAQVRVTDLSTQSLRRLERSGFQLLSNQAKTFDYILCADSLGEVNSDEDDWLKAPENEGDPGYPEELEQRYGLAGKLSPLKSLLAPDGKVLLFEPVKYPGFWKGTGQLLSNRGWNTEVHDPVPTWYVSAS